MYAGTLDRLTRKTLIESINLYQDYVSPRKGFACPHRLLYGDKSCSEYVKTQLFEQDLRSALKFSSQRFRDCATAAKTLASSGCIVIPCCLPLPL